MEHKKSNFRTILFMFFSLIIFLGMIPNANALVIDTSYVPQWSGSSPVNPNAGDIPDIVGYSGTLTELYKQDVGAADSGPYAGSYVTAFFNTPTDPEDATITWVPGTDYINQTPIYLLVKDGAATPRWYIFDISSWNGQEIIELNNFWAVSDTNSGRGAISHVALYGGATSVPEPSTLLLLGAGLIGFTFLRRRR